jgi:hypothetical protein
MKINPQKYRIAFVIDALYYPFTYPEILNSLASRKYRIETPPPSLLGGARIYAKGNVASKDGCFIHLNEDRKVIACEGRSIDNVISSAKDIIDISTTDFKMNIPNDVDYCELTGSVVILESGNPMDAIKAFSDGNYGVFDEILGGESAGYSIRIVPKNGFPTDRSWFDIVIEPRFATANREYYIEIVYRKEKDVESVLNFATQLNMKIIAIINKIRGG